MNDREKGEGEETKEKKITSFSEYFSDSSDEDLPLIDEPPEFYGSDLDESDEKWANKQRKGRMSDAILSCPCCLTTLCIDCQRHEKYATQFRAMFVRNCRVVKNEVLRMAAAEEKPKKEKKRRNANSKKGMTGSSEGNSKDEILKSVHCAICDTEVGVMDAEEVYHLFNVLPTHC